MNNADSRGPGIFNSDHLNPEQVDVVLPLMLQVKRFLLLPLVLLIYKLKSITDGDNRRRDRPPLTELDDLLRLAEQRASLSCPYQAFVSIIISKTV